MKLPDAQIELAASTEDSRYAIKAVKLDVAGKRLLATDGSILAIVPTEVNPDEHDGLIPADAIKAARKLQKTAKSVPIQANVNGKFTINGAGQSAEFELATGKFPNCDVVIPKFDGAPTITLDAELLLRLAKAIRTKGHDNAYAVSLWIKDAQSAVLVKGEDNGAVGVIMPRRR